MNRTRLPDGLPIGMQLSRRPQADLAVLRIAQAHAGRTQAVLHQLPAAAAIR